MKKLLSGMMLGVALLAGSLQANAADTITLSAGSTVTQEIYKNTVYTLVLNDSGSLSAYYEYNNYTGISSGYTIYRDASHNDGIDGSTFSYDWEGKHEMNPLALEAGTYYFYCSNGGYTSDAPQNITFTLSGSGSGGNQNITVSLNEKFTLAKGQKATLQQPANLDPRASYEVIVTTNSTTLLGQASDNYKGFLTSGNYPLDCTVTAESTVSGYVYKMNATPGYIFPLELKQDVVESVDITITMPTDEVTEITLGSQFSATSGKVYSFGNTSLGAKLTVKTNATSLGEQNADNMIFRNESCTQRIITETLANNEGTFDPTDGNIELVYILTAEQTYYFKCPVDGNYTFTIEENKADSMEPSTAQATLVSPVEGQTSFTSVLIKWEDLALSAGKMGGATITGPNNETYEIGSYTLSTTSESSSTLNGLSLNFKTSFDELIIANTPGDYKIYLPKGIVMIGESPNAEVTLTYTLNPDVTYDYFDLSSGDITPSTDGFYSSIKEVSISFEDAGLYFTTLNATSATVQVNNEDVEATIRANKYFVIPVNVEYSADVNEVEIVIPQNIVRNNKEEVNQNCTLTYTLLPSAEATFSPESGTKFGDEDLDRMVTVTWDGEISLLGSLTDIYLVDSEGDEVYFNEEDVELNDSANPTGIIFNLIGLEDGAYTLTIPASLLLVDLDGEGSYAVNVEETAIYLIGDDTEMPEEPGEEPGDEPVYVGNATANITVGEQGGITSVSITWANNDIELNPACNGIIVVTSDIEGEPEIADIEVVNNNTLVITFVEEFTADDSITVTVPEGYVLVGDEGALNEEQTFNLTSTGVGIVGIDSELGQVYTIQGLRVKAQKASELPAGLYIINGKKVGIRK